MERPWISVRFVQPTPGEPTAPTPYVDPKTIRFGLATTGLYWTSEGDPTRYLDPFVREICAQNIHCRGLPPCAAAVQLHRRGRPGAPG